MSKTISTATFLLLYTLFHAWLAVAADQKLLEDIKFETPSAAEERITFKLNGTYVPKIFAIKGEKPRVVFDFPETRTASLLNNIINTNGKFIKRIRVGIHNEPTPKTRVVFDLLPDKKVDFKQDFDQEQNALIITVYHAGNEPQSSPVLEKEKKAPVQKTEPTTTLLASKNQTTEKQKTPVATPLVPPLPLPQQVNQTQATPPYPEAIQHQPETKQTEAQALAKEEVIQAPNHTEPIKTVQPIGQPVLSSITFDNSTNRGEMVLFKLNEFHSPIVFGVEEGQPRVVCDFKNTKAAKNIPNTIKAGGKYVHTIRIGRETSPQKVRVVLDLAPNNNYDLQQVFFKDDNTFVIIINTLHNVPTTEELKKPLS